MTCSVESAIIKDEWGYDELVKRIPCRVVRSVPINGDDAVSRAGGGDSIASENFRAGIFDVGFEFSSDSGGWTFGPGAVRVRLADSFEGMALDILA